VQASAWAGSCASCAVGRFTSSSGSCGSCNSCTAAAGYACQGTGATSGGGTACPVGTWSSGGASSCQSCAAPAGNACQVRSLSLPPSLPPLISISSFSSRVTCSAAVLRLNGAVTDASPCSPLQLPSLSRGRVISRCCCQGASSSASGTMCPVGTYGLGGAFACAACTATPGSACTAGSRSASGNACGERSAAAYQTPCRPRISCISWMSCISCVSVVLVPVYTTRARQQHPRRHPPSHRALFVVLIHARPPLCCVSVHAHQRSALTRRRAV
jgi:hypothetical protein